MEEIERLFSYGTLRYPKVQLATFGRLLEGKEDSLPAYRMGKLKITDPDVIAKSGEDMHSVIEFSGSFEDQVSGMVFEVTPEELSQADEYEVDDYKRVHVRLKSGLFAWVYVHVQSPSE